MAASPHLTEAQVRALASPESFDRGEEYYEAGAVLDLARRGDQLRAEVEGSSYEPYQVTITLDAGGVATTDCTCPYDWGGVCKHIIATLLAYIRDPDEVEERTPVETLLADLSAEQLRTLLTTLAADDADLADRIEMQVQTLQRAAAPAGRSEAATSTATPTATPRPRQTPLDGAVYRRQARAVLHSLDRMSGSQAYAYVGGVVDQIRQIADQARPFLDAGDGRSALAILEAVTEEYVNGWFELDDSDGDLGGYFSDLGALWTEAIVSADLTPAERKTWAQRLAAWQNEVDDYGVDEAFDAAEAAAKQGWDYPPLVRVLQGKIDEEGAWEDEPPWYADDLAQARLKVLERQGRTQEYLYLAEAEGQMDLYLTMLAKLGRVAQVVEEGIKYLGTPEEALAVAKALRERGAIEEAIRIGAHGLSLESPGGHARLAGWLRDVASAAGQPDQALAAARVVMQEAPTLADYQALQALAGERWPAVREEVLDALRKHKGYSSQGQVDIFLHEGLIDDAIAVVESGSWYGLIERVVEAAVKSRPEWAVNTAWKQARPIIENGQSKYYSAAAQWLARAGAASATLGRQDEWRAQMQALIDQHRRKYSLVPLLENVLRQQR